MTSFCGSTAQPLRVYTSRCARLEGMRRPVQPSPRPPPGKPFGLATSCGTWAALLVVVALRTATAFGPEWVVVGPEWVVLGGRSGWLTIAGPSREGRHML